MTEEIETPISTEPSLRDSISAEFDKAAESAGEGTTA